MLGDLSGVSKIFVITGRTDMRKSFDGLMAIIRDTYELDPYANAVYLFCGRDSRKLKALHFDKDGFVLLQKRLDGNGRFQWPRNASEARLLTRQVNNPVPVSLLSGDRKPQIRFLGNHHSGSGNLYHKSFRM